ncbi:MAG: hypothetical protein RJQ14_21975 [Marinoscillum sp.]
MRTNTKTYLTILGVIVALLLLYSGNLTDGVSPKFSYSIKSKTQTITNQFTSKVGAEVFEMFAR